MRSQTGVWERDARARGEPVFDTGSQGALDVLLTIQWGTGRNSSRKGNEMEPVRYEPVALRADGQFRRSAYYFLAAGLLIPAIGHLMLWRHAGTSAQNPRHAKRTTPC